MPFVLCYTTIDLYCYNPFYFSLLFCVSPSVLRVVISIISPHVYYCSLVTTTATGWKPNCSKYRIVS